MTDPLQHFRGEHAHHHALATGMILGALVRSSAEQGTIVDARPFTDAEGNYTNQLLVQVGGRLYTITVDEALEEATRS